jgi:hypothetical protein
MDYDALGLIPLTTPVEAHTDLNGQRAHAERAPTPPPPSRDESSASEAAAQAVIDRLQSILDEPTASADAAPAAQAETHAEAAPASGPAEAAIFVPTGLTVGRPRRRWVAPLGVLVLGAVGIVLLALAALWGFQPTAVQVLGVSPRTASLTMGFGGLVCFSIAVYYMLERLGMPRDRIAR